MSNPIIDYTYVAHSPPQPSYNTLGVKFNNYDLLTEIIETEYVYEKQQDYTETLAVMARQDCQHSDNLGPCRRSQTMTQEKF